MGVVTIPLFTAGLPPAKGYLDVFMENLGGLGWDYLEQQVSALLEGWLLLWGSAIGAWLAAALVLPGLVIRLGKNHPDAWYVIVYLGMLIAWPFPEHMPRFLWPLLPAFLVAGNSAAILLREGIYRPIMTSVAMAVILMASIPDGIARSLDRMWNPPVGGLFELSRMPEWTRSDDRQIGLEILQVRRQFLNDMRQISQITPSNSCIYSEHGSMITAQTQRVGLTSTWETLDDLDFLTIQCRFYYMIPSTLPDTETIDVDKFGTVHRELFRSKAQLGSDGIQILGVFFELQAPVSK
jgi:hypothetical protein